MEAQDEVTVTEHILFKSLPDNVPVGSQKCLSLVACNGDVVYLWNSSKGRVEAVNKKLTVRDKDLNTVKVFYPSRRPLFNVERILLNVSGTLLALWGPGGVSVVQLPSTWNQDSLDEREMPSVNLGCHRSSEETVLQVRWHPGSPLDSHLVVLTSDGYLRLYDSAMGPLFWSCSLSYRTSRSNLPCAADLGQIPVDFDFSVPVLHEDIEEIEWPILVLWGNGEVYTVVTKLKETNEKLPLLGPLLMFPESDDNYGVDASSIAVIDTSPPIVVLATCDGTIYNCLLVSSEGESKLPDDPGKSLCVVESIELELGIFVGDASDDPVSCPIRLEKDPIEKSRYLCVHKAGVHSITLPLVAKLMEYANNTEEDFSYNLGSLAEYFLCTAVTSEGGLSYNPILGLTHLDLEYYLVVLSDGKILRVALPSYSDYSTMNLMTRAKHEDSEDDDRFRVMIQNILHKSNKPPLLKLPLSDAAQPKIMLEIGLGMMQRHREDLFKTYRTVAQKIKDQVRSLKVSMTNQRKDIERLMEAKAQLQNQAESIAERYEEINEKQSELMSRTEELLKKLRCHEGVLTLSEKKLNNILDNVSVRMGHVQKELDRIRLVQDSVRMRNLRIDMDGSTIEQDSMYMGEAKKKMVRSYLEAITVEIQSLTKRIKDLKAVSNGMFKT